MDGTRTERTRGYKKFPKRNRPFALPTIWASKAVVVLPLSALHLTNRPDSELVAICPVTVPAPPSSCAALSRWLCPLPPARFVRAPMKIAGPPNWAAALHRVEREVRPGSTTSSVQSWRRRGYMSR